MMAAAREELVKILREARGLLARPKNAFIYCSWKNADEGLAQIDALVNTLEAGALPSRLDLSVLFAPTGPLQEVSIDSGWPDEFIELSRRFDAALEAVYQRAPQVKAKKWWKWWG